MGLFGIGALREMRIHNVLYSYETNQGNEVSGQKPGQWLMCRTFRAIILSVPLFPSFVPSRSLVQ